MWTAAFVFTLAKETGWSEHYIFWELPLSRLYQYQHCALRAADVWTVPPAEPEELVQEGEIDELLDPPAEDDAA